MAATASVSVLLALFTSIVSAVEDPRVVFSIKPTIGVRGQVIESMCYFKGPWVDQVGLTLTVRKSSPSKKELSLFNNADTTPEFQQLCSNQCPNVIARFRYDAPQPITVDSQLIQPRLWHISDLNSYDSGSYWCQLTYKGQDLQSKPLTVEVAEVRSVDFLGMSTEIFDVYAADPPKPYQFNCSAWVTVWNSVTTKNYDVRVFFEKDGAMVSDVTSNFTVTSGQTVTKVPEDAGEQFSWLKQQLLVSGWVTLDTSMVGRRLVCAVRPNSATMRAANFTQPADAPFAVNERGSVLINKKGVDPDKDPVRFNCTQHHGLFKEGEQVVIACNISQYGYDVDPTFIWNIRNRDNGAEKNCTSLNVRTCQEFLKDLVDIKFPTVKNAPVVTVSLTVTASRTLSANYNYTLIADYAAIRTFQTDGFSVAVAVPPPAPTVSANAAGASGGESSFSKAEVSKLSKSGAVSGQQSSATMAVLLATVFTAAVFW